MLKIITKTLLLSAVTLGSTSYFINAADADSKFVFRYTPGSATVVSSGGGNGGETTEPETPVEPEEPSEFNSELFTIEKMEADYIDVMNVGGAVEGDFIQYKFLVKNGNDYPISSFQIKTAGGSEDIFSNNELECGKTQIPAHSERICAGVTYLTQADIDRLAPNSYYVTAQAFNGVYQGRALDEWELPYAMTSVQVSLPLAPPTEPFDIAKDLRIEDVKLVWSDRNNNGIMDAGDYLGVTFRVFNNYAAPVMAYRDFYFGPTSMGTIGNNMPAKSYTYFGSSLILNDTAIAKMNLSSGLNSRNGAVTLRIDGQNRSFNTDNSIQFMYE